MRIGICFSGQIRTGVEASDSILSFIGDLLPMKKNEISFFRVNELK